MDTPLLGLHHVTAIVDDPQANVDFYTQLLGLWLVKRTVNFDDPHSYHLYYGDDQGRPGTILTFFAWPGGRRGSRGTGQISAWSFGVPTGALAFWQQRLAANNVRFGGPEQRGGAPVLSLYDPAGLLVELVEQPYDSPRAGRGDLPAAAAIQGIRGVTLTVAHAEPTAAFLTERLGFRAVAGQPARYALGEGAATAFVTLDSRPDVSRGEIAAGSVHHVAWRAADDAALPRWQAALGGQSGGVTDVRDRQYFHSIYFREPGGVLFEIATDPPGFAADELPEQLGSQLKLPPWLESQRATIERHLPPLRIVR